MPHVSRSTYPTPPSTYKLQYVEIIHRHHKRTPYASNLFPVETQPWDCSDAQLHYYGSTASAPPADTYWVPYHSSINPFPDPSFPGNCAFPQITSGGLSDSHKHGSDLAGVYRDLLGFLPDTYSNDTVKFRVTNNVITSQVAGALIPGLFSGLEGKDVPLRVQRPGVDSLEPQYSCPAADAATSAIEAAQAWTEHLNALKPIFGELDGISGVDPSSEGWHVSVDHYFDNLSARLCHGFKLPCKTNSTEGPGQDDCVSRELADTVFRVGEWEYSRLWRDDARSLTAGAGGFGVWAAELVANIRERVDGGKVSYRHNVAHDGSLSRLLALLQLDKMVWPGMGAEVVFEVWEKGGENFLRIMWGGRILTSSSPTLGKMDMVPIQTFLEYLDGLIGENASKVTGLCAG